jgi:segregation and condensation protein A
MAARPDPNHRLDGVAAGTGSLSDGVADEPRVGKGGSPYLTLDGFAGPLDDLLTLARAQKIDLTDISLTALIDQLTTALQQAPTATSLGEKGDWVVMAAWLVQLRTRLLLPADAPGQRDATAEADQLRGRLVALAEVQALGFWLEQRPQLGRDAFTRGRPEIFGVSVEAGPAIDVVEFLWASLALFDDDAAPDTTPTYRPEPLRLHTVAQARERILQRLNEQSDGAPLAQMLPDTPPDTTTTPRRALQHRSGWAVTLVAALELAKQGEVVIEQEAAFQPIRLIKT